MNSSHTEIDKWPTNLVLRHHGYPAGEHDL